MTVSLTKRELDVMSVVWELGTATVGQARDRIPDDVIPLLLDDDWRCQLFGELDSESGSHLPLTWNSLFMTTPRRILIGKSLERPRA